MGNLWQDIRYAFRSLLKKPGFTAVAIFSLTLGIGANTTIFTMVKAVFLQPFPVKDVSRLVVIYATEQPKDGPERKYLPSAYLNAVDYREKNDVFSGLSLIQFNGGPLEFSGGTRGVGIQLVNWDFFDVLGVKPMIGRAFSPDEDQTPGAKPVAILSYRLWNEQFGADKQILGKTIRYNHLDYNVIGVMGPQFQNVGFLGTPGLWVPMMMHDQAVTGPTRTWYDRRGFRMLYMVARLKPGVTVSQASASVTALGNRLAEQYPKWNAGRNVMLMPFDQTNVSPNQRKMFVLAGTLTSVIVGLVLLIACGNVANLLLARAMQRRREIAVRLSLGASRARVIRQLMTESALLGLASAGLGLLIAPWTKELIFRLVPGGPPPDLDFSQDTRVLVFTIVMSILATLLFGLVPALQASRVGQMAALKERTDAAASGRWYGLRGALVTAQVAFSLIALMGSALFIHSLRNAQQLDPGFETKHELLVFPNLGNQRLTPAQTEQYYHDFAERLRSLPNVAAAGVADCAPFNNTIQVNLFPEGTDTNDPRNGKLTPRVDTDPGYFDAAGISMIAGRDFNEHDDVSAARVIIVNKTLADLFWPGQDPIGRRILFRNPDGPDFNTVVVGEVRTVKYLTLGEPPQPMAYFALRQRYNVLDGVLYVRTKGDPQATISGVMSSLQSLAPNLNLRQNNAVLVSEFMNDALTGPRFGAQLLTGFGALALLLAAIGTYGVMSYAVSQRTQEIGIRMALGAQRRDVLQLVLGHGMAMVCAGVAVGLGVSVILTRQVNSLLYGIGSFDALSFFATASVLLIVALAACWLPTRRAMRVDPMIALRYE